MEEVSKKKLRAAGKIAFGVYEIGSGALMATGHGILGGMFKQHGMMHAARQIAVYGIKTGSHSIEDGLHAWRNAR